MAFSRSALLTTMRRSAMPSAEAELIDLTKQLLDATSAGDWSTYPELCDPTLTCFEPESRGHLVQGMPIHMFYFDLRGNNPGQTTIALPHVRLLGTDVAIVSDVRLSQQVDSTETPQIHRFEETRIWLRSGGIDRVSLADGGGCEGGCAAGEVGRFMTAPLPTPVGLASRQLASRWHRECPATR